MSSHATAQTSAQQAKPANQKLQCRLAVGSSHDPLEHEAEQAAKAVMQSWGGRLRPSTGHTPRLSRAPAGNTGRTQAPDSVQHILATPGEALPSATRAFFETRFAHDFSQVRIHHDAEAAASAREVNALAYSVGDHVVFDNGRYAPDSFTGRRLLAHELAHVVQQQAAQPLLQRAVPEDADAQAEEPAADEDNTAAEDEISASPEASSENTPNEDSKAGDPGEGKAVVGGRVRKIVIARDSSLIVIETASVSHLYELERTNIDTGDYTASINIKGKRIVFDFGKQAGGGELFYFRFRINRGQDHPINLLKGQKEVNVEVISRIDIDPATQTRELRCLLPMDKKTLIKQKKFKQDLFKSFKKNYKWNFARIPLGYLGWVDANAEAGVSLAGLLSGGYGPGELTEICLFRKLDANRYAGSARFKFGAAISPSVSFRGKLRISADYLSVASLASAEGGLKADAIGSLRGGIDGRVDLVYDRRRRRWSFDAEAELAGHAGMKIDAKADAAISLLSRQVWSKQWILINKDYGISWQGGLKIGSDTKPKFIYGSVGVQSGDGPGSTSPATSTGPSLPSASAPDPLAQEAEVDGQQMLMAAIDDETGDPAVYPQGQTEDDPLPIVWYKPLDIYPREIDIPRAVSPATLDRDDGPTPVHYRYGRGTVVEDIGVGADADTGDSNWPRKQVGSTPGKTFQRIESTVGNREKDRLRDGVFRDKLLPAGTTLRSLGFDLDHVHEKQFGGKDALPNLWPADYEANQHAGREHDNQLNEYRRTIGNISGHWFEIIDIRMP